MQTNTPDASPLPPTPRPLTPRVRSRSWADPHVRFWWLAAAAVAAVAAYLAVSGFLAWRRTARLVERGTPVTAEAVEVDAETLRTSVGGKGRPKPPDSVVRLSFDFNGSKRQVTGTLDGRTDFISVGDSVPLRIDPDDPAEWTARTTPPPLLPDLIGAIIATALAVPLFAVAVALRRRVLRTWREGQAAEAVVLGRGHTALAPRSRAVRCAPPTGAVRRATASTRSSSRRAPPARPTTSSGSSSPPPAAARWRRRGSRGEGGRRAESSLPVPRKKRRASAVAGTTETSFPGVTIAAGCSPFLWHGATPSPPYSGERAGVRGGLRKHFGKLKCLHARPLTLALSPAYRGEGTGEGTGGIRHNRAVHPSPHLPCPTVLIRRPPSVILATRFGHVPQPRTPMKRPLLTLLCALLCLSSLHCKDPAKEKVLNLYIWSEYLPQSVLDDFRAKTGITVHVANFGSNEELLEKLQSGVTDYDVVVPSDYMVHRLIARKLVRPLDRSKLSGFENLDAKFLDQKFDPGNQYSIPYFWGTTGIGYNTEKVKGAVDSWDVMWDKDYSGKISMLNDGREVFAAALLRMGKGVNETDPKVLEAAAKSLKEQKPLVRYYDSDSFNDRLAAGDVVLAQGYNGQFAKSMKDKGELAFVVPKEGGTFWMDNLCVTANARHTASVDAFLNYILQPEVAAKIAESAGYGSPNAAARKLLPEKMLKNEVIYPPEEVIKRCKFMEDLGDSAKLVNQYMTEIKAE